MNVFQTPTFSKVVKKLHKNQKQYLDKAIKVIVGIPDVGDVKAGDLAGISIYKFKIHKQLVLLAYLYKNQILTLMALGMYENFYRDFKKFL